MARKKSASKKAREQGIKPDAEVAPPVQSKPEKSTPKIEKPADSEDEIVASEDEDSEEEDQYGELLTEDVEEGLNKVLQAIKTGDKALFDQNVKFFKEEDETTAGVQKPKESKPIYLKDYHRMNLLDGRAFEDEDGEERDWEDGQEKPYALQQQEDKSKLLSEIKKAFSDDEEEEDGFLKKKEKSASVAEPKVVLPDPQQNGEEFLQAFLDSHAWIPKEKEGSSNIGLEEDDDEFDEAAEKFENAYNFRYEDPNAAEIISYARSQATMRREKLNSRKRQRINKTEERKREEEEKQELLRKKKQKKLNQVMDRLNEIRKAVGSEVSDETITKVFGDSLLNDDFDDGEWDNKMAEIFNEQFYGAEDKKPEWDEDDEIMGEFKKGEKAGEESSDEEVYSDAKEDIGEDAEEEDAEDDALPKSKKSKKKEEKLSKKKEKGKLKEVAHKIVDSNSVKLLEEVEEERGRSKEKEDVVFKYREVSPESFGLSTREILLADDTALNDFIGLKKFAPYRPKDQRLKDKRKYAKKRRLREWRMQVFQSEEGPKVEDGDEDTVKIPVPSSDKHKSKKRKISKGRK